MKLICHPAHPPSEIAGIDAEIAIDGGRAVLNYRVAGGDVRVPPPGDPVRTDGLWRTTCFEMFVGRPDISDYVEFNFAPSRQWAAYRFADYRAGGVDLPMPSPPLIEPVEDGIRVTVDLSGFVAGPWRIGLTAVIEEANGTLSYWALAHHNTKPDFHDPRGFVIAA